MTGFLFDEMAELPQHCRVVDLDPRTLSRTTDPITSHAAAQEIVESGAGAKQCQQVLELLRLRPVTARELVAIAVNYRARVSDLRKAGYRIECRECRDADTGKKTNIYFLTEDE